MTTFHSDTLHVSYSYPASYADASAMVGPALEASLGHETMGGKDASRCVTLPFSAMNSAQGLSLVLLARADAGCLKKKFTAEQLPGVTEDEVQGLTAAGAHTQFGKPVAYTLQGHPAELLRGSFSLPTGQRLNAMVTCVLLKPDVACWQFLASSGDNLRTMGTFPVSVDGSPAEPLVPATVFARP